MTFSAYGTEDENESIGGGDATLVCDATAMPAGTAPVAAARASDRLAPDLVEAFWPHVPLLKKYLRRRVPVSDLDDVLQDVLLGIVRRADATAIAHPKCYLFRAAQAVLIDRHRRQATRRADCHCPLDEPDHPVDEMSPLRILLAKDEVRAVEATLGKLPERTQKILVAIRIEGSSLKSLASQYNVSTSAIEKHVNRAAKALSVIRRGDLVAANRNAGQRTPASCSGSI